MKFTPSTYGYWIDAHANIIPVAADQEHSGVALKYGLTNEKALAGGWVRVSLSAWAQKVYAEFERPLSPASKEALYWIAMHHGYKPWDERKDCLIEAKRMSVAERLI